MAFSYSNSKTVKDSGGRYGYTLHITLTEGTPNTSANTSPITYKLWMTTQDNAFYGFNVTGNLELTGVSKISNTITNAELAYKTGQIGNHYFSTTSLVLLEGTVNVPHGSDGKLNMSFKAYNSATSYNAPYPAYMEFSGSGALTDIPRVSTLSLSSSTHTMGVAQSFTINKASSGFTHRVTYSFGSASNYIFGSDEVYPTESSFTWTPPTTLASQSVVTGGNRSAQITYTLYTYNAGTRIGSTTVTATLSLPSADVLTSVPSAQTMGTSYNFSCSQHAPNYSHILYYSFGSLADQVAKNNITTQTFSFTPPTTLGSQIPTANSGAIYYYLATYNGTTFVGATDAVRATLSIPANSAPTFSFSATVANNNSLGVAIANMSTASWSCSNVQPMYGASIASYAFTFAGISSSKSSGSGIRISGGSAAGTDRTPTMVVTDSRGKSTTHTGTTVKVYTYGGPTIISSYAYRANASGVATESGTYVNRLINAKTDYSCGGKNTLIVRSRYKESQGEWAGYVGITNNTAYIGQGIYSSQKTYLVELSVVDSLGGHKEVTYTIRSEFFTAAGKEGGHGFAFFGIPQRDNDTLELYGAGGLYIGDSGKLRLWEDTEGGNLSIYSPNGQGFHLDAFSNNALRFYRYNDAGALTGTYFDRDGNVKTDGSFYTDNDYHADGNYYANGNYYADGNFFANGEQCLTTGSWSYHLLQNNIANDGSKGAFVGYGVASISWVTPKLVKIDYMYQVTKSSDTVDNYSWGLNRNLFTVMDSSLPTITPVSGGWWRYIPSSGSENISNYGYGAVNSASGQFWVPARMYQSSGSIGSWPSRRFTAGGCFIGTCYGQI